VYRLVHAGNLEAIQVGRSFRIPEHAISRQLSALPVAASTNRQA
jgi:excisionase family DNA binding protein